MIVYNIVQNFTAWRFPELINLFHRIKPEGCKKQFHTSRVSYAQVFQVTFHLFLFLLTFYLFFIFHKCVLHASFISSAIINAQRQSVRLV
jgi:hypothetical protein